MFVLKRKFTLKVNFFMIRKRKILFFCMMFAVNAVFSQNSPKTFGHFGLNQKDSLHTAPFLPALQIPANFYATQLGFFCKKEWKFESVTKLPFKFRLGNIQYCDWLEGKKGALLPVR